MIIIVMGVTGCGKTTIGELLSQKLGCPFIEGDLFHPASNVEKMRRGIPLTDEDRWPWLKELKSKCLEQEKSRQHVVLACSALKQSYRDLLSEGANDVRFIYIKATPELVKSRLNQRKGHFMPASLIESQFSTLEEPTSAKGLVFDAIVMPEKIVTAALSALKLPEV